MTAHDEYTEVSIYDENQRNFRNHLGSISNQRQMSTRK